jgi:hypothetical protein
MTIAAQTVYSPLNLIPEDGLIILAAHFDTEPPAHAGGSPSPRSAPSASRTSRYFTAQVDVTEAASLYSGSHGGAWSGASWSLASDVEVGSGQVVVVGFDEDDRPVGLTTWEFGERRAGAPVPFDLTVSSLGPAIDWWSLGGARDGGVEKWKPQGRRRARGNCPTAYTPSRSPVTTTS